MNIKRGYSKVIVLRIFTIDRLSDIWKSINITIKKHQNHLTALLNISGLIIKYQINTTTI